MNRKLTVSFEFRKKFKDMCVVLLVAMNNNNIVTWQQEADIKYIFKCTQQQIDNITTFLHSYHIFEKTHYTVTQC